MNHLEPSAIRDLVDLRNAQAASPIVVVCEHASSYIPPSFEGLGLPISALKSHVVWDPGALAVAENMATRMDATLVAARTSRLVYDCNRPPDAVDAMPAQSEVALVPGNAGLSDAQKEKRVATYYEPFRTALSRVVRRKSDSILVTIHSFTPIFQGRTRDVEIGILHDSDTRLADAMMSLAAQHTTHTVERNEPYGPDDGVTHTLKEHALTDGHLNVMIEVRNDLIADERSQAEMAEILSPWVSQAISLTQEQACNA